MQSSLMSSINLNEIQTETREFPHLKKIAEHAKQILQNAINKRSIAESNYLKMLQAVANERKIYIQLADDCKSYECKSEKYKFDINNYKRLENLADYKKYYDYMRVFANIAEIAVSLNDADLNFKKAHKNITDVRSSNKNFQDLVKKFNSKKRAVMHHRFFNMEDNKLIKDHNNAINLLKKINENDPQFQNFQQNFEITKNALSDFRNKNPLEIAYNNANNAVKKAKDVFSKEHPILDKAFSKAKTIRKNRYSFALSMVEMYPNDGVNYIEIDYLNSFLTVYRRGCHLA